MDNPLTLFPCKPTLDESNLNENLGIQDTTLGEVPAPEPPS